MGSGGGQNQTQQTSLPAWAQPSALEMLNLAMQTFFPGGQLAPARNFVAGFSPDQIQSQNMVERLGGVPVTNGAQGYINWQPTPQAPPAPTNPWAALFPGLAGNLGGGSFPGPASGAV